MKHLKLSSLVIGLGLYSATQAQTAITLTGADLPTAYSGFVTQIDTTGGGITITAGSSSAQTWNYSSLGNHDTDSTWFYATTGMPGAANFTGATMCMNNVTDSVTVYFKTTSDGMYVDGYYISAPSAPFTTLDFNPDDIFVPIPFTYNTVRNHTSRYEVMFTYNNMPVKIVHVAQKTITGDAFGSLQTPLGTYPNTIRSKEETTSFDSTYANFGFGYQLVDNSTSDNLRYSWYRNGNGAYLMGVDFDTLGAPNRVEYLKEANMSTPVHAKVSQGLKSYPNPAVNELNIDLNKLPSQQVALRMFDIAGKEINLPAFSVHNGVLKMDVSSLPAGLYFYEVSSEKTKFTGKFNRQ